MSCLVDAVEKRSIATCDIVGAFLNAEMMEKVYIVIRQKMVDILLAVNEKNIGYSYILRRMVRDCYTYYWEKCCMDVLKVLGCFGNI